MPVLSEARSRLNVCPGKAISKGTYLNIRHKNMLSVSAQSYI